MDTDLFNDPSRFSIMNKFSNGLKFTVGELVRMPGTPGDYQESVEYHLRILVDAKLVTRQESPRGIEYGATPNGLQALSKFKENTQSGSHIKLSPAQREVYESFKTVVGINGEKGIDMLKRALVAAAGKSNNLMSKYLRELEELRLITRRKGEGEYKRNVLFSIVNWDA